MTSKIFLKPLDILAVVLFVWVVKYWRWRTKSRKAGLTILFEPMRRKQDFCNHEPGPNDYN